MLDLCNCEEYPICDSDIWINVCYGKVHEKLVQKYGKIVMADVVAQEVSKKPGFVKQMFQKFCKEGKIMVIHHTDIPEDERQVLEYTLQGYGFSHGFQNIPAEKNKGEIVSAIYADHFGISILASNDHSFKEGGDAYRMFNHLNVYDWKQIAEQLTKNHKERIKLMKLVEDEQEKMNDEKKRAKI